MDRDYNTEELKNFIRDLIEEEFTPKGIDIGPRWEGGKMVLTPGNDTQPKEIPLEIFFKKPLSVRDSLRVLEQKINSHSDLTQADKSSFHSYITKAYGSLTTFNILFKEDRHKFVGHSGKKDQDDDKPQMTLGEARKKLGLNEY